MCRLPETKAIAEATSYEYTIERYYYTKQRRFEQSVDVYKPNVNSNQSKIPVVLVMGSGWLGHKPYFYTMTNWWNSSAPKQICGKLGHPCVSIRHSGGFLLGNKNRSAPYLRCLPFLPTFAVVVAALATGSIASNVAISICLLLFVTFMYVDGIGAASIDDMVSDVSTALAYIDEHAQEWGLGGMQTNNPKKNIPVVFGGYSSGAHVAATLLTASPLSPILSSTSTEPEKPKQLKIRSVLYLSGVLDVSPESFLMSCLSKLVLRKSPSDVPSPLQTLSSLNIRNDDSFPPHILIGCRKEVFGWSILDSAFCASEYAESLRSSCVNLSVRLILLDDWTVNHWSILSSSALRNALRDVLASQEDRAKPSAS